MADRAAHIELTRSGAGSRILVDGHDITNVVAGLRFSGGVRTHPQLELDLVLRQIVAQLGTDTVVSPETAAALQLLGWTAPRVPNRTLVGDPALRDQIIGLVSPHSVNCQDSDCGWCDRAARIADQILAAVAEHYGDEPSGRHVIEFRPDGWSLKHPLACRPDLFACPLNRVAETETSLTSRPDVLGRYEVELNDIGDRLLILDRVDQAEASDQEPV